MNRVQPSDGERSVRLSSLTGLRFIAAFLVFVYHAHWLQAFSDKGLQSAYDSASFNLGNLGVAFFFVLSGFVLTWSARAGDGARSFWRRRFFKVFPNHVVAFALAFGLLLAAGITPAPTETVANLFLVHAWVPELSFITSVVSGVSWSLSVELVFYLCFPLLIVLVRKVRPTRLWVFALTAGALVLALPALSELLPQQPRFPYFDEVSWAQAWTLYYGPLGRILEFVIGMFFARIVANGRDVRIGVLPAALLVAAAYTATLYLPMSYGYAALFPLPIALLISAVARREIDGRATVLGGKAMVRLGEISYAFFLIHMTLLFSVHAAMAGQWAGYGEYQHLAWSTPVALLFLAGVLVLSLALSWLMFTFVEMPVMRRWSRSRKAPSQPEPVPAASVRPEAPVAARESSPV
ncbi:acyltransferase family protein [Streptomyces sp. Da 82-17]|uniref:acyltransferase family protein n=1 Tax=Streptomyces sp. Da 82-17 TaxID=3377116 RepID=UPI0038D4BC90